MIEFSQFYPNVEQLFEIQAIYVSNFAKEAELRRLLDQMKAEAQKTLPSTSNVAVPDILPATTPAQVAICPLVTSRPSEAPSSPVHIKDDEVGFEDEEEGGWQCRRSDESLNWYAFLKQRAIGCFLYTFLKAPNNLYCYFSEIRDVKCSALHAYSFMLNGRSVALKEWNGLNHFSFTHFLELGYTIGDY